MTNPATISGFMSLLIGLGCGSERPTSSGEQGNSEALPSPAGNRELLVTAGVFSVELGGLPAERTRLFEELELATDLRVQQCLSDSGFSEAEQAADTQFVGILGADRTFTMVGPSQGSAPAGFAVCLAKVLESGAVAEATLPAAYSVDVRVRAPNVPCTGPFCQRADPPKTEWRPSAHPGMCNDGTMDLLGLVDDESPEHEGSSGASSACNPPSLDLGAPSVTGALPAAVIRRGVRQVRGRIRRCYHDALVGTAELAGTMIMSFRIKADGSVSNAGVANTTMKDKPLGACVTQAFTGLRYPQPEGGTVKVQFPLTFSPREPDKPPTVAGKELWSLTSNDLRRVLETKGWSSLVVQDPAAPSKFALFAAKGEQRALVRLLDQVPVQRELPADIWLTSPRATLVAVSLTDQRLTDLVHIVDPR